MSLCERPSRPFPAPLSMGGRRGGWRRRKRIGEGQKTRRKEWAGEGLGKSRLELEEEKESVGGR